MKRIWKCPLCDSGKRAPGRMHRNNVLRWCLVCSEKTGKLVERVCPALDKQRASKSEATRVRRDKKKATVVAAEQVKYMVAGFDMMAEFKRLSRLPVFGGNRSRLLRRPPKLVIRRCSARPRYQVGYAKYNGSKISVSVWPGMLVAEAVGTLMHECCHASGKSGHKGHKRGFRVLMAKAAEQGYGVDGWMHIDRRAGWRYIETAVENKVATEHPAIVEGKIKAKTEDLSVVRIATRGDTAGELQCLILDLHEESDQEDRQALAKWMRDHERGTPKMTIYDLPVSEENREHLVRLAGDFHYWAYDGRERAFSRWAGLINQALSALDSRSAA